MNINSINPLNASPQPGSPPAANERAFAHQLSGFQHSPPPHAADSLVPRGEAYSPYLDTGHPYSQYLDSANPYPSPFDWQDDLYTRSTASPAPLIADRERSPQPSEQQPHARALQDVPEYDQDLIWQHVDAAGPQAGTSQAGPSQAGPSSSAGAAPAELKDFVTNCGLPAWDHWVLAPQTASEDQMNMLRAKGLMPTAEVPTTTFLMMGVPHTAEFREEGLIRIRPSFDSGL
ncbi:hypothetical protein DC522_20805 [Microvirga sp. KLBC 81]|nr:hypothetical protein DC522_20805 [Microvirga sp. KLBC 81]